MMMHAYQEMYVSSAQSLLADAFDYAMNACEISGEIFIQLFLISKFSKRIENGETAVILGKSGIELVKDIYQETYGKELEIEPQISYSRSVEYWIGYVVAYYQWFSNRTYKEIFQAISFSEFQRIYYTLHEADISKVVDIIQERIAKTFPDTNLKRMRKLYGCSQSDLAKLSGVSLRSIQMYEQRQKDINKASALSLYKLAKVLGCRIEDLIEK